MAIDQREVLFDGFFARITVPTEPGIVSGREAPERLKVVVCFADIGLGNGGSSNESQLLVC